MSNRYNKSKGVVKASKTSAIAEHLVNKHDCAINFILKRFKINKSFYKILNLIKLEAICIFLRKSKALIFLFFCFYIQF